MPPDQLSPKIHFKSLCIICLKNWRATDESVVLTQCFCIKKTQNNGADKLSQPIYFDTIVNWTRVNIDLSIYRIQFTLIQLIVEPKIT